MMPSGGMHSKCNRQHTHVQIYSLTLSVICHKFTADVTQVQAQHKVMLAAVLGLFEQCCLNVALTWPHSSIKSVSSTTWIALFCGGRL